MKKNVLNLWLLAALMCGLSLSVTSCKDDDKLTDEERQQQELEQDEQEMTAYNVLDYLANLTNAPEDYLTGSYEPTIGVPDDGDNSTRIEYTNNMETAAMRFADLIDGDIDENTTSYTWSDANVGTLTYTKGDGSTAWATVDVNIKQIPHLQKIIYRSPAQAGDNSGFKGTAYYRFGDIVKKQNSDGEDEFWICVRPCFGPEGKEKSHWVTIDALPTENIYTYHSNTNGIDYALPTKLGDNHEHSQNFAELLFAICFPSEWEENITYNPDIKMFHDFDRDNLRYHSKYFWERVQKAWTDPSATTNKYGNAALSPLMTIFGSDGKLEYFKTMLKSQDGLNLLSNGKSWKSGNSPTLYRYRFVNGQEEQSNMHQEPIKGGLFSSYHSVTKEVIKAKIDLNCKKDYKALNPGWTVPAFFGTENKHYIIRHAKGSELASDGKEDTKAALKGVTEVYRYNAFYGITDLTLSPEILTTSVGKGKVVNDKSKQNWTHYRGDPYYRFGDIYKDENGHKWMVLLMAGMHQRYEERNRDMGDSTCFAELISFDGLTPSTDKRQITNLPTRDQVMRAAPFLKYYQEYANNKKMKKEPWDARQASELGPTIKAQLDECKFDIRMLFQIVRAQREEYWNRQPSRLASIAYRDPTDETGKQRLLRFIDNSQNEEKVGMVYYWEHYVAKPDAVTELYPENRYDKTAPIYLQDIASQDWIGLYAEDSYARQPLFGWDSWVDSEVNGPDRQPRDPHKDLDSTALDVTNYYYDMAKWKTRNFPRDMWNEPVLMFRMTAVYDRGDEGHGTITVDGHTLTPLSERTNWTNSEGDDFWMMMDATYRSVWISGICKDLDSYWLDGKRIDWPDPFKAWKKEY